MAHFGKLSDFCTPFVWIFYLSRSVSDSRMRKKSYRNLSGGQQQRVLLARALCATTKVILLDEPVTGLDPIVTKEFYKLLKQINKKGITVIMVSHDMSVVEYASHVLFLSREKTYFTEKKSNMTDEMWIDVISKGVVQC